MSPLTFLIFIAFIPLLYVADGIQHKKLFFFLGFLALLTWNAITTWWMWNSTDVGSIAAIIANSLIMYLPWWGYRIFKRKFGRRTGYISLVLFWMAFEYIHLNWQLSWPWLTLGNVFASNPNWVQWYEVTGTSGGTLWVLVMNILLFEVLKAFLQGTFQPKKIALPAVVLILPLIISFLLIPKQQAAPPTGNVVIVQPNIDPNGRFASGAAGPQVQLLLSLTAAAVDDSTRLVIWPETALTDRSCFEDQFMQHLVYEPVFSFMKAHPNTTLQTGIEVFKGYREGEQSSTARPFPDGQGYYDAFNAAVTVKAGLQPAFYHKSRLVPGVETLPTFLKWMGPVFEQFGGTTGGYGRQEESSVFQQPGQPYITAPIICYESIYGEYVATFVKKGANMLTIMTNDGWWGNTPGHKQHLAYARLRAIETRRWVARSANTGISAVINERGEVITTQPWDKEAVIKYNIPVLTGETFYVKFGDLLSKAALALACVLFAWNLFDIIRKKLNRAK